MERTIELLTPKTPEPTAGSGGTLNTDITEMLVLLGNRLSGIETQLNNITKMLETEPAEEQETPAEEQETPAEEQKTPAEGKPEVDEYGDPVVSEEKSD